MLGRVSVRGTLLSNSTGALVNTFIPLEAGEVVKGALLRQRSTEGAGAGGAGGLELRLEGRQALRPGRCSSWRRWRSGNVFPRELRWPVLGGVVLSFLPYLLLRMLIRARPAERLTRLLARVPRLQP